MTQQTLAETIQASGGAISALRNSPTRRHTFPVTPEFTNWRSEQRAWRDSCALLDQSHHMTDLFLRGPDAVAALASLGVNSFKGFEPNHAKQYVAVNPDGFVIGDAVLFYLGDGLLDLVGHPMVLDWVEFHIRSGDLRVELERDDNSDVRRSGPPVSYRYELQGPTALQVLEAAAVTVPDTRFFHMADFEIAGRRVRGLRHGMAGRPGFELFGPWDDGEVVLETLLAAGRDHGLVRVGAKAYSTANLESGWVPAPFPSFYLDDEMSQAYREWAPAEALGSLSGSLNSDSVSDYCLTPYDLGYGRLVAFDHEFIGRSALERLADGPNRTKVTLVWDSDDVSEAIGSMYRPGPGAKYIDMPKARYGLHHADEVVVDGRRCGISMDCGYISNERVMVSLASVDADQANPGTEVTVMWGEEPNSGKPQVEEHKLWPIRATVAPAPYVQSVRREYRSA